VAFDVAFDVAFEVMALNNGIAVASTGDERPLRQVRTSLTILPLEFALLSIIGVIVVVVVDDHMEPLNGVAAVEAAAVNCNRLPSYFKLKVRNNRFVRGIIERASTCR
jgi:hypothetical protein